MPRGGCPHDQLPWAAASHMRGHSSLLQERKGVLRGSRAGTLGSSSLASAAHSRPLPFSLAATDRSHERDSMLSPGHPPIKPLDHRVVLGTPNRVSDPRISCLLSASMKLWQAELDLK